MAMRETALLHVLGRVRIPPGGGRGQWHQSLGRRAGNWGVYLSFGSLSVSMGIPLSVGRQFAAPMSYVPVRACPSRAVHSTVPPWIVLVDRVPSCTLYRRGKCKAPSAVRVLQYSV